MTQQLEKIYTSKLEREKYFMNYYANKHWLFLY